VVSDAGAGAGDESDLGHVFIGPANGSRA
jgi:hypothetical protein